MREIRASEDTLVQYPMSYHVYISKPGFKEEPIAVEQWISVAKEIAAKRENFVIGEKKRKNKPIHYFGHLNSSKGQRLDISPYGLVVAQDPTRELVEIMFEVAGNLGAQVYSERSKPYEDVADWEKRTRHFRLKREGNKLKEKKRNQKKWYVWLAVCSFGALLAVIASIG